MRSGLYRHNATTRAVRLTQQRRQTWEGNTNSTIVPSATDDGVSTMSKDISTLVDDIYDLFENPKKTVDSQAAFELGSNIASTVKRRLTEVRGDNHLRMSNIGKGDRQVWYDIKGTHKKEELRGPQYMKFLFGDILEHLLVYLAKESGHAVTNEQQEVDIVGIKGHIDCEIDGELVDIKSASTFSFGKFKSGSLLDEGQDAFGYIPQISGYAQAKSRDTASFLVVDKTIGNICLMPVNLPFDGIDAEKRITHMKSVLKMDEPPPHCYKPVADGKSGNMKLGVNCSYCPHKMECWKNANDGEGLRTFIYSTGPRYLTSVVKLPKVFEPNGKDNQDV